MILEYDPRYHRNVFCPYVHRKDSDIFGIMEAADLADAKQHLGPQYRVKLSDLETDEAHELQFNRQKLRSFIGEVFQKKTNRKDIIGMEFSEKQLEDMIWESPETLDSLSEFGVELVPLWRQLSVPSGVLDLVFGECTDPSPVIESPMLILHVLELKIGPIKDSALCQVIRYTKDLIDAVGGEYQGFKVMYRMHCIGTKDTCDPKVMFAANAAGIHIRQAHPSITIDDYEFGWFMAKEVELAVDNHELQRKLLPDLNTLITPLPRPELVVKPFSEIGDKD